MKNYFRWTLLFLLLCITLLVYFIKTGETATDRKVYVALGFHVNLYHSFRGDTNDEAGYGVDIDVIRHIITNLDYFNSKGVPVKAVWDFDNLFSLESLLPRYAPDIMENLKRRVREQGDEVILMSYNNAMVSVLNREEFSDSLQWSITNPRKSGVKDIFGKWTPIVRPQEMMISPGQYGMYKEQGIDAVALYYSSINFDGFKLFTDRFPPEQQYNPVEYRNKVNGETITVIPTYNIGDLVEHVSLNRWVTKLHLQQHLGKINKDVLIFVNFDGDSKYWVSADFPEYLQFIPNTGGIEQLINGVAELDFVEFTTLGDYLKNHPPLDTVTFGQDLADGSFNGYNSWAEKTSSHAYWSAVMRNRRIHKLVKDIYAYRKREMGPALKKLLAESYRLRMKLLSSTNYGMATPFLARAREDSVQQLVNKMDKKNEKIYNEYIKILPPLKERKDLIYSNRHLQYIKSSYYLKNDDNKNTKYAYVTFVIPENRKSTAFYIAQGKKRPFAVHCIAKRPLSDSRKDRVTLAVPSGKLVNGTVHLYAKNKNEENISATTEPVQEIFNGSIRVRFSETSGIQGIFYKGNEVIAEGSLLPQIHYGPDTIIKPGSLSVTVESPDSKTSQVLMTGELELPVGDYIRQGSFDYMLTLVKGVPYLYFSGTIQYPESKRRNILKENVAQLIRKVDSKWKEVMPAEIRFSDYATKTKPFKVIKRNFCGIQSSFLVDYYKHSEDNLSVANVNNQVTPWYNAIAGKDRGIAIAMDTTESANFAFCPVKIKHRNGNFRAFLNPFGTYHGNQNIQPFEENGQGNDITMLLGEQFHSAAPTYNGIHSTFSLMIAFFKGRSLPVQVERELQAFGNPDYTVHTGLHNEKETKSENTPPPAGFIAAYGTDPKSGVRGVFFHWENVPGRPQKIRIYCGGKSGTYNTFYEQDPSVHTLFVPSFEMDTPFEDGKEYFAAATSFSSTGKQSRLSEEITFIPGGELDEKSDPEMPVWLRLKIFLSLIESYINPF